MLRSFIFKLIFYLGFSFLLVIFLPSIFFPKKIVSFGGKLSGYWAAFCLRLVLSTKIEVKGFNNIIKNEKFFIACTHQSEFETYYLQTLYQSPYFILKKELLKIPIFGILLKKLGCISIDRNKISKENINFLINVENSVKKSKDPLIIFPQGTRYKLHDRPNFKKGVERIYNFKNLKCQPIVINSGNTWPKHGNLIPNQKIIISILPAIDSNLESTNFLEMLQSIMYKELDKLI
ncbi:MAG: 1-acyl-sn-glycerol-3-phosphate acyltransferase [Candidatus Pelagibacter sp.]|nr:1-acyl-sn-glycerol-3-phosphate acyltransferase [Candidatus Pelagibacter sp.]|tara:strand:+ start:161 stop:862 length:702 start_codon:yes stop_codon:yes gene_type:complete